MADVRNGFQQGLHGKAATQVEKATETRPRARPDVRCRGTALGGFQHGERGARTHKGKQLPAVTTEDVHLEGASHFMVMAQGAPYAAGKVVGEEFNGDPGVHLEAKLTAQTSLDIVSRPSRRPNTDGHGALGEGRRLRVGKGGRQGVGKAQGKGETKGEHTRDGTGAMGEHDDCARMRGPYAGFMAGRIVSPRAPGEAQREGGACR